MTPINPTNIRYIKLGRGGRWAGRGLDHGEMHVGYRTVPHDLCLNEDWNAIVRILLDQGRNASKAKDGVREIRDFYTLGSDCLWVTFADAAGVVRGEEITCDPRMVCETSRAKKRS